MKNAKHFLWLRGTEYGVRGTWIEQDSGVKETETTERHEDNTEKHWRGLIYAIQERYNWYFGHSERKRRILGIPYGSKILHYVQDDISDITLLTLYTKNKISLCVNQC